LTALIIADRLIIVQRYSKRRSRPFIQAHIRRHSSTKGDKPLLFVQGSCSFHGKLSMNNDCPPIDGVVVSAIVDHESYKTLFSVFETWLAWKFVSHKRM
jgi:hypothetical protein